MKAARALRIGALAAVIVAAPASAPSWYRQYDPWPNGSVNMQLQLGSNSGTLIDGTTSWGQSAEYAMSAWNAVMANFEFRVTRDSTAPTGLGNRWSNVFWDSTVYGRSFNSFASPTQTGGIVAVSMYWQISGVRTETDVVFNNTLPWNSYRGAFRRTTSGALLNEFYRTALHEFGHSLGLQHPNDYGQNVSAIMNSTLSDNYTLTADDIGGVQSMYGSTAPSAPGVPGDFTATSSGSTINLAWSAPTSGGTPTAYTIEAGSSSGLANLASFSTGSTATSYSAGGVANGSYYVRVKATNAAGSSPASNEALLTVGSACSAPGAPGGLRQASASAGTVSLTWTASTGTPTTYIVEAGSSSGLSNLANSDLGGTSTTFTASGVARGTYYVRLRARNACGTSAASNEITLTVP